MHQGRDEAMNKKLIPLLGAAAVAGATVRTPGIEDFFRGRLVGCARGRRIHPNGNHELRGPHRPNAFP